MLCFLVFVPLSHGRVFFDVGVLVKLLGGGLGFFFPPTVFFSLGSFLCWAFFFVLSVSSFHPPLNCGVVFASLLFF